MKTTIDIADSILEDAKQAAARRRSTLKEVLEISLRQFLAAERLERAEFKLEDKSVPGHGVQPGISEGDWQQIRSLIYEGRGG